MSEARSGNDYSAEQAAQIHEAVARLYRRLRAAEMPDGLTQERLSTLAAVRSNEPVSLTDLAAREGVSVATMSRMIASLEAKGLLRRRDHKSDGRAVLISTTAKGRRAYVRAVDRSLDHIVEAIETLDSAHLAAIKGFLVKLNCL